MTYGCGFGGTVGFGCTESVAGDGGGFSFRRDDTDALSSTPESESDVSESVVVVVDSSLSDSEPDELNDGVDGLRFRLRDIAGADSRRAHALWLTVWPCSRRGWAVASSSRTSTLYVTGNY